MKKTIFVLLFALITFSAFAQGTFGVEAGYIPSASSVDYSDQPNVKISLVEQAIYVQLDARYTYNLFFVGGSVLTYMFANTNDTAFFPFYTSYTFEGGLTFGIFEIGYEHRCSHPIAALGYIQEPLYKVDSSSDRLYVRAEVQF